MSVRPGCGLNKAGFACFCQADKPGHQGIYVATSEMSRYRARLVVTDRHVCPPTGALALSAEGSRNMLAWPARAESAPAAEGSGAFIVPAAALGRRDMLPSESGDAWGVTRDFASSAGAG